MRRKAATKESNAEESDRARAISRTISAALAVYRGLGRRIEDLSRMEASKIAGPDAWRYTEDETLFEILAAMDDVGAMMSDLGRLLADARDKGTMMADVRAYEMRDVVKRAEIRLGGPYEGESAWPEDPERSCPACLSRLLVGPKPRELFCVRCQRLVSEPVTLRKPVRYYEEPWRGSIRRFLTHIVKYYGLYL